MWARDSEHDRPFAAGRHPYQVWVLQLCAVAAIGAFGKAEPGSLESLLDPLFLKLWGGFLLVGAVLALVGPWLRDRHDGAILERTGQLLVCATSCAYAIAIVEAGVQTRLGTLTSFTGFAAAAFVRYGQLTSALYGAYPHRLMWRRVRRLVTWRRR